MQWIARNITIPTARMAQQIVHASPCIFLVQTDQPTVDAFKDHRRRDRLGQAPVMEDPVLRRVYCQNSRLPVRQAARRLVPAVIICTA